MKLNSMRLTSAEAKEEASPDAQAPRYPWGLSICLDDEALKKLSLGELPELGDELTLLATVRVTAVSSSEYESGPTRNLTLQITDMALDDGDDAGGANAADRLYDNKG